MTPLWRERIWQITIYILLLLLILAIGGETPNAATSPPTVTLSPSRTAMPTLTATPTLRPSPTATATLSPNPSATATLPTPTGTPPTPTPLSPAESLLPQDIIDTMRITSDEAWQYGGAHAVIEQEEDALVLARVAMGEAPASLNDRALIMWLIRIRAELGFKNARSRGTDAPEDRWGEPTTIRNEALCIGGCQYEPVRHLDAVYFPFTLRDQFRGMVDPLPDQMGDLWFTYLVAQGIVSSNLCEVPVEMRGYDSFKSPEVAGEGRYWWDKFDPLSLPSVKFFENGNIWEDRYPFDNNWFQENCK